ncbi:MAG TPA: glycosyltransferase family A protein [Alloacidobacterium sp.]|nr:glycosyltransferase family A protein [Alloacidobacterium sp.]
MQDARYVIITPVRDEEKYIEATISSVKGQTMRPVEWVIVDDGSSDRTSMILDAAAAEAPWIRIVHRADRGFRKAGGGVVEAFYDGYSALQSDDWEFIVKLDGDLSFSGDYFERCFDRFCRDPRLGIGGGVICHDVDGEMKIEPNPGFHVRGATKIYRRACWEAIGGLWRAPGWDTIDEVQANRFGWTTQGFNDCRLLHHRLTGSADGAVRDRVKHGVACYISRYHLLFVMSSCLYRLVKKPYVIGSAAMFYGFLKGHFSDLPRVKDKQYVRYMHAQQLRRLCGLQSIWK